MSLDRPRLSIGRTRVAYLGPSLDLAPHRNAAATLALSLDKPFRLQFSRAHVDADAPAKRIALIPPGTWHHLVATGPMLFLYLDAQAADLHQLAVANLGAMRDRLPEPLSAVATSWQVDDLCAAFGLPPPVPPGAARAAIGRSARANGSRP